MTPHNPYTLLDPTPPARTPGPRSLHEAQFRRETAEKIARGEDPYVDFARRAREDADQQGLTRVWNGVKRRLGSCLCFGKARSEDEVSRVGKVGDEGENGGEEMDSVEWAEWKEYKG